MDSCRLRFDPRPSVEERYKSYDKYQKDVGKAIDGLVKDRFLLCEDTEAMNARLLKAGIATGVLNPTGRESDHSVPPHGHQ